MALGAAVLALIAAIALSVVGVATLADSRRPVNWPSEGVDLPVQRLPYTPTALVGTIDEDGRLTTVAVLTIEPDGTGGSIVEIAASADANSGNAGVLEPLNAVLAVEGPDAFALDAEVLTGVSFDVRRARRPGALRPDRGAARRLAGQHADQPVRQVVGRAVADRARP